MKISGFTLIEVLVALVILAIGLLGVIKAVEQTLALTTHVRAKIGEHYVVMEILALKKLNIITKDNGVENMLGFNYQWQFREKKITAHLKTL